LNTSEWQRQSTTRSQPPVTPAQLQAALVILAAMTGQTIEPAPTLPAIPEWMTVDQYAARINASPRTVRKMVHDGLPHARPRPRLIRIRVVEADQWIQTTTRKRPNGTIAARKGKL
jgi:excisionase family DNA binding protein